MPNPVPRLPLDASPGHPFAPAPPVPPPLPDHLNPRRVESERAIADEEEIELPNRFIAGRDPSINPQQRVPRP